MKRPYTMKFMGLNQEVHIKILCVMPSYWPAFRLGGPISSVHLMNKALAKRQIDITVYTTNVTLENKVCADKEIIVDGVKVTYFSFTKFFEFLGKTGWQFSLPMAEALKANLGSFDLVYIVGVWNYPTAIAAYYCKRYKKPYIISPRGILYPRTIQKKFWKKRLYYYFVAGRCLEGAASIHYTTPDEAVQCHSLFGLKNKITIIPNGIDLEEFVDLPQKKTLKNRYPYLKDKKVILFLGRINWKKGMDILVKAYSRLAQERSDVHLLIAGDDNEDYAAKVKKWVRANSIEDRVTFTGMLLGREKLEAYTGSDLFVLPSYSENFGMAVVEALACGTPVVISNMVGIHREIERKKAGVVIECNETALYRAMRSVLDDNGFSQELSLNGRRLAAEHYNIANVAEKTIKAYAEILNGHNYTEHRPDTRAHRYIIPAITGAAGKLKLKSDLKILDAGCGMGNLMDAFYKSGFTNIWGFDKSENNILFSKEGFYAISDRFFRHDAYEHKLPDGIPQKYGFIISAEVIEHLYSPREYLKNIHSWLDDGGYLIITTPYHGYIKNLLMGFINIFDNHFNSLCEGGHIKFFSKRTISILLNKEGFEIIKFKPVGRMPFVWKSMILVAKKTHHA